MFFGEIPKSFIRATTTDQLPRAVFQDSADISKRESPASQSNSAFTVGSLVFSVLGEIISAIAKEVVSKDQRNAKK